MKATRVPKQRAASRPLVAPRTPDEWERGWQRTWKKLGFLPYELPADDSPAGQERDFLTRPRTAEGERERLARIQEEFERGFRALGRLGPAVTVFGSARFKEGHRYYELAREVGRELARAGFVTITGGGPGIMEAANRGAREAGGAEHRPQHPAAARAGRQPLRRTPASSSATSSCARSCSSSTPAPTS